MYTLQDTSKKRRMRESFALTLYIYRLISDVSEFYCRKIKFYFQIDEGDLS